MLPVLSLLSLLLFESLFDEADVAVIVTLPDDIDVSFNWSSNALITRTEKVQLPSETALTFIELFGVPPSEYILSPSTNSKAPELFVNVAFTPYSPGEIDVLIVTTSPTFTVVLLAETEILPAANTIFLFENTTIVIIKTDKI